MVLEQLEKARWGNKAKMMKTKKKTKMKIVMKTTIKNGTVMRMAAQKPNPLIKKMRRKKNQRRVVKVNLTLTKGKTGTLMRKIHITLMMNTTKKMKKTKVITTKARVTKKTQKRINMVLTWIDSCKTTDQEATLSLQERSNRSKGTKHCKTKMKRQRLQVKKRKDMNIMEKKMEKKIIENEIVKFMKTFYLDHYCNLLLSTSSLLIVLLSVVYYYNYS